MGDYPVRTAEQLPALLQGLRRARRLTQADMALRLGITQQTYSVLERHAATMGTARLMQVLAVLGAELVLRERPQAASPVAPDDTGTPW